MPLRRFMGFHQWDSRNSEYKEQSKEHIEVLEAYNGGFLFRNSLGDTAREITLLGIYAEREEDVRKAQISTRGKYLETAFLLRSDRRRYVELILLLKNYYTKQQRNYPKTLTDMYSLIVAFEPTRATPVARGRNKGLNFGNVVADSEDPGTGDTGGGDGGAGRKLK